MPENIPENVHAFVQDVLGIAPIEQELKGEQASSLGRTGKTLAKALEALEQSEGRPAERGELLQAAADAAWSYLVQREACGLRDHRQAISWYRIPNEVLARLGARAAK